MIVADVTIAVEAESLSKTRADVRVRDLVFSVDEPERLGGTNAGPNPVEYLLAAFIGCINVVAHLTAREMGLDLHHLEITATGALNPARLFGDTTADRVGFKTIEVVVRADTDADSPTLERWLDTVKTRCPVSDNLANPTPVTLVHQPWPR